MSNIREEMKSLLMQKGFGTEGATIAADHLLANGMTIQKHGQWICQNFGRTRFKCSVCQAENYDMCYNHCPNCGAKMEG